MKILKKIKNRMALTLALTLCSFVLAQPSMAVLDSLTPKIAEIINKAPQPEDAKKKICAKEGILRGSGLFAGNNCKKTVFAQLFKIMCSDDADAMKSKCADKASSATSKADIAALAAAFGKSAKAIGTDAEAILCKTPRDKLPLALKTLADSNCVAAAVIAPVDMTKNSYNILSLDGGGIRGIGTLVLLAALEMKTGKKTYELFDMIIGTSTGGLIAIMLSEGKSATAILDFYVENGPLIFQRTASKKLRSVGGLLGTKYSAKQLELIIKENIGDKKLSDSAKPIGVTSYNVTKGEQQVLSSWDKTHSEKNSGDAARATSAAPTYFKGKEIDGDLWVDGGVGANDPSTSAFAEAKRFFPEGAKLRVVSIGTGEAKEAGLPRDSGILNVKKVISTLMKAGSEKSNQELMQKLSSSDKNLDYRRFQFSLPESIDLADTRKKAADILMKSAFDRSLQPDFIAMKNDLVSEINAPKTTPR